MNLILNSLLLIIQHKFHMKIFLSLKLHFNLPINNNEFLDNCFNIYLIIFQNYPKIINNEFISIMKILIEKSIEKSLILFSYIFKIISKDFFPIEYVSLLLNNANFYLKSNISHQFISILFHLYENSIQFKRIFFNEYISILENSLKLDHIFTLENIYYSLSHININFEIDFKILSKHLLITELTKSILSFLILINEIPIDEDLIESLLICCKNHLEAHLCLLKIAAFEDGTNILLKNPYWISQQNPDLLSTLKLFLACMIHDKYLSKISLFNETYILLYSILKLDDLQMIYFFSIILRKFPISQFVVSNLSKFEIFLILFNLFNKIEDNNILLQILLILNKISENFFTSEYLLIIEKLKLIFLQQSIIFDSIIITIVNFSQYPLCAKKFKDLNLLKYFNQLQNDINFNNYYIKFINNLKKLKFY